MNKFKKNCCDGVYNSFDVHFTSACDNRCKHCIDLKYAGMNINKPDVKAISNTIISNKTGYDDVLFLGGEPCLYLQELVDCIKTIQTNTHLKVFVTTSVPKTCHDNPELFSELMYLVDGINLSVQHHNENIADQIRNTKSQFDRQVFYRAMPFKEKVRVNINIVKPFLFTKKEILNCLRHYDAFGFSEIKLSEIQHGKEFFVSFEDTFDINLGSPYYNGCQMHLDVKKLFPGMTTPVLLKRSCFLCEGTLKASVMDGVKTIYRLFNKPHNRYGVVYENGFLSNGWR